VPSYAPGVFGGNSQTHCSTRHIGNIDYPYRSSYRDGWQASEPACFSHSHGYVQSSNPTMRSDRFARQCVMNEGNLRENMGLNFRRRGRLLTNLCRQIQPYQRGSWTVCQPRGQGQT
jgi:hypothetical protein